MAATTKDKILIAVSIAAAAGLFLWGRSCGIGSVGKTTGTVKEVRKDSIVFQDRPVPYRVDSIVYVKGKDGKTIHDTLETFEVRIDPADTAAILARFYQTAYYNQTIDTGRATISILDTVTQNRIQGRSVKVVFTDSIITNTITLKPPQRLLVSFGLSISGSRKDPFHMAGADLSLKLPNDRQYIIGANIDKQGTLYGEFGMKWPIRLKKRQ